MELMTKREYRDMAKMELAGIIPQGEVKEILARATPYTPASCLGYYEEIARSKKIIE